MTRLHRGWLPTLLASALAFAACGGDDDGDTPKTDAGGVDGGGVDASIKDGGAPSDAGSDASVATGLQCKKPSDKKCGPYMAVGGLAAEPCCYTGPLSNGTTADSVCSGKVQGVCMPPAIDDARCDNITISLVQTTYKGCCTLTGQCGINNNAAGLGCPDLATTEATVKMLVPSFSIPSASKRACNAADAGTTVQALGRTGIDAGL